MSYQLTDKIFDLFQCYTAQKYPKAIITFSLAKMNIRIFLTSVMYTIILNYLAYHKPYFIVFLF